jgi:(p)ppGpp synthase/HD superfamily hydrolase
VEIVTAPGARPNPAWLNFVITSKARGSIRHFLKDQQHSEAVDLGRRLLEKALSTQGYTLAKIPGERLQALLAELGVKDADTLLEEIGLGNRVAQVIAARLLPEDAEIPAVESRQSGGRGIAIRGTEGLVITYARCCRPLPGDAIVGHLSAGRGIVIHRDICNNILSELRDNPDKCMSLRWADKVDREFQTELRVELENQRGLLAEIARQVTEMDANIEGINIQEKSSQHGVMNLSLQVHDRIHLARIIKRIRIIKGVEKIIRVRA